MKIRFTKKIGAYALNQEVSFDKASDAQEYVDAGVAVEVKAVEPGDVSAQAVDGLLAAVDAKISAVETKIAKAFSDRKAGISKTADIKISDRMEDDPQAGFKSAREYFQTLVKVGKRFDADPRIKMLVEKSTTGNTEGAAPDAGPTVPVQYVSDVFNFNTNPLNLFNYTKKIALTTSSAKVPVIKKYSLANSTATAGVVAAWTAEASAITQSKSNWEQLSLNLNKIAALVPVSDETLADNNIGFESWVPGEIEYQIVEGLNKAILKGSGSSQPTGIIGHASAVNVAKEASQTTGSKTVIYTNVMKMYAAFYGDYNNAVWLMHPSVLPDLASMTSGQQNIFCPAGVSGQVFNTLLGRPIIVTGWCNAEGTSGDIVLADFSRYYSAYRDAGVMMAQSIHLFFNTDETAFRGSFRYDGKPGLTTTVTLQDGSTAVSPFVTLATR